MLVLAATLCFAIGLIHSVLGERYILVRLFRRTSIPHLFGNELFTKRTLRFAWHLTTVAWWGLGYMTWGLSRDPVDVRSLVLNVIVAVFSVSGAMALIGSKGKNLSWVVFWAIAGLA